MNTKKLLLFLTALMVSSSTQAMDVPEIFNQNNVVKPMNIGQCREAVRVGDSRYRRVPTAIQTNPQFVNLQTRYPNEDKKIIYCMYLNQKSDDGIDVQYKHMAQ